MSKAIQCEAIEPLLSGFLDDELSQSESQRVALHLKHCEKCSALLTELETVHTDLKETLHEQSGYTAAEIEQLDKLLNDKPSRWLGTTARLLVILGALVVGGYAIWELGLALWQDTSQPVWLRASIAALYLGFAGLFVMVLRQRIKSLKTDKYRKVKL